MSTLGNKATVATIRAARRGTLDAIDAAAGVARRAIDDPNFVRSIMYAMNPEKFGLEHQFALPILRRFGSIPYNRTIAGRLTQLTSGEPLRWPISVAEREVRKAKLIPALQQAGNLTYRNLRDAGQIIPVTTENLLHGVQGLATHSAEAVRAGVPSYIVDNPVVQHWNPLSEAQSVMDLMRLTSPSNKGIGTNVGNFLMRNDTPDVTKVRLLEQFKKLGHSTEDAISAVEALLPHIPFQ